MHAIEFWQTVVRDRADLLGKILSLFAEHKIEYCVIGGQAVNAYAEPVVSLDLDIVVATDQIQAVESLLRKDFRVETFEHSLNISMYGSDLRVRIQTDPRYSTFPSRATTHEVLGVRLPVASLEDLLQGKVWAILDTTRRPSKRQKDLADVSRLLEAHAELREMLPQEVADRLF
jgi:hypothetical protein